MKSIRISDSAYSFLRKMAKNECRSIVSTLDLFIKIYQEVDVEEDKRLETKNLP